MSGGHFEYKCHVITQFADELQHEIDTNKYQSKKDSSFNGRNFSDETIEKLSFAQRLIKLSGKLAREIEWLYSGDHGEESFADLFDKIMSKPEYKELIYTGNVTMEPEKLMVFVEAGVDAGVEAGPALKRLRGLASNYSTEILNVNSTIKTGVFMGNVDCTNEPPANKEWLKVPENSVRIVYKPTCKNCCNESFETHKYINPYLLHELIGEERAVMKCGACGEELEYSHTEILCEKRIL